MGLKVEPVEAAFSDWGTLGPWLPGLGQALAECVCLSHALPSRAVGAKSESK